MRLQTATAPAHSIRPSGKAPTASHSLTSPLDQMGAAMNFTANAEIYGENEPAEYLYKVISGTVRTSKILSDGRRQIGAFYGPGDVFGLEAGDQHAYSAEAVSRTKILVIKRSVLGAAAARDHQLGHQLLMLAARELGRYQDHILLMVKSAQERVAGFLLERAAREQGDEIELPMSRQDIADYLGLTIETVSRTFTQLEHETTIGVPTARHIVLRNRAALKRLNS